MPQAARTPDHDAGPSTAEMSSTDAHLKSAEAQSNNNAHSQLQLHAFSTALPHIALHPPTPLASSSSSRDRDPLSASVVLTPPLSCTPSLSCSDESCCSPVSMAVEQPPLPVVLPPPLPSSPSWRGGQRRRPVISMGPRADCEKCRLKVPDHWMHFD